MDGTSGSDSIPDPAEPAALTVRDQSMLAFERRWWKHAGAKEQAIRAEFGLSAARYYQILGVVIDSRLAVAHDPMLVKRLQRMRDARSRARADRSLRPAE
ncbi:MULTISPECIES: DUF3263 domain-containing protein [Cryobacterium]|uniref:DUF3263 domain-containing protein n=1 Tax=Cryobacterium breve TaxID=1259258 RepID=A0ABY2J794_9MICO|nr:MULTISPECIES: DUF3263 domain-containing protein [Cryobacterium]TFC96285.1 DUF3263 domain-containing protein [Cryobacterium sp. TmT3-12]TFD00710.1 DUF3263 domain-containing protein [Cryobacterium breve]